MRLPTALPFLLALVAAGANAQGLGGGASLSTAQLAEARAACEQLGSMPNAPLSVEACKAMLNMGTQLQTTMSDPSAQRPGDEAMTCAAIFAELQTVAGAGVTEANRDRAETALADATALGTRQGAEFGTFVAGTYALGAVLGATSAFTPNFVGAALVAVWQASAISFATKQIAERAPVQARTNEAMLAGIGDLGQSMQDNPRFARLVQLGMAKQCEPPKGASR